MQVRRRFSGIILSGCITYSGLRQLHELISDIMDDKTQVAILRGVVIGTMLGGVTGIVVGVTTGQLSIGIGAIISLVIVYSVGISLWNIRRIK